MVKSVIGDIMKYGSPVIALMLFFVSPSMSWGQVLSDPTRPPSGMGETVRHAAVAATPRVKGLQSVILSPNHCAAIIDGKTVVLGEKHGDERLIEVNERGVVLMGTRGRHEMPLFPAVGMVITEAPGQQAIKCISGQPRQAERPPTQAGKKEKK